MSNNISPLAYIEEGAQIGENVKAMAQSLKTTSPSSQVHVSERMYISSQAHALQLCLKISNSRVNTPLLRLVMAHSFMNV